MKQAMVTDQWHCAGPLNSRDGHKLTNRRTFLRTATQAAGAIAALTGLPTSVRNALAIPAHTRTKSINDVQHIVILMQENRSFDHYFGALRGVRGFGDRFPVPLESGKSVWHQSNGTKEVTPFHVDQGTMNAALIADTPHNFPDQQGAWSQGKFGHWPMYMTDTSMGYYKRAEAPFQWALADAFTLCDGYFCSVRSATDPNRVFFWSGSNFDPARRRAGLNSDMSTAEVVNLRCWVTGTFPAPGYKYRGSALAWKTIPEVLQDAGISWRIYQNPNNNWSGAMNGALAFEGFRNAQQESPIYKNGLSEWSLEDLKKHAMNGTLPAVSWICPSQLESEHPGAPSSPARGADFTEQVLSALTANPKTWSKTVLFVTFDENDGLFDHVPSPAVPSYNADGTLAGKSTVDLRGMYFQTDGSKYSDPLSSTMHALIDPRDKISGNIRPWGMGARVPMYVISPWSKGGWVNSQIFDHSSVGQFIEKRFGVTVPAISPWSRAVSGDLTSAFNFANPNDPFVPPLPNMRDYASIEATSKRLPAASPPSIAEPLFQEPGTRPSRALPYELHTNARVDEKARTVTLLFSNTGAAGAVFHVYDKKHLDRIPRRYTVEAGKALQDDWNAHSDAGDYDLMVYGPNGYFRRFKGSAGTSSEPDIRLIYEVVRGELHINVRNSTGDTITVNIIDNAYRTGGPWAHQVRRGEAIEQRLSLVASGRWYDFSIVSTRHKGFERRVAGRMETGKDSFSDPASAIGRTTDS
jgi:phospholipase C